MTNTLYLEEIIKNKGIKKTYLADKLGITVQSLTNKITNRSLFNAKEIDELCKELDITKLSDKEAIFFYHKVE